MADLSGALDTSQNDETVEPNCDDASVIPIQTARLSKIKHSIKKLYKETLSDFTKEMEECRAMCSQVTSAVGELNGAIKKGGGGR